MKFMVHEMKTTFEGVEIAHLTYMQDNNRMQAEIYRDETCIFSGWALEAPEYYEEEKNRLKNMSETYGGEVIILK